MNYQKLSQDIVQWIREYAVNNKLESLHIAVSGGIDSAVVSTLCAMTSLPTFCYSLPIESHPDNNANANIQLDWLHLKFPNTFTTEFDLTHIYKGFSPHCLNDLSRANTKSRIRMVFLYSQANNDNGLVVGTGNACEDMGIFYFTKFGDGGVDISPIGGLMKSEVYGLAKYLQIPEEIQKAIPNDGLYKGNPEDHSDEKRIGASYDELEWAMKYIAEDLTHALSKRQEEVLNIYNNLHSKGKHKAEMPPIFKIDRRKYKTYADYHIA